MGGPTVGGVGCAATILFRLSFLDRIAFRSLDSVYYTHLQHVVAFAVVGLACSTAWYS